jgi:hypothetical protein
MSDMFKATTKNGVMEHEETPGDLLEGIVAPAEWDDGDYSPWDLNGSDKRRTLPPEEEVIRTHNEWRKEQAAKRKEQRETPDETPGETPAETLGMRFSRTPGGTLGETPEGTLGRTSSGTPGRTLGEDARRDAREPTCDTRSETRNAQSGTEGSTQR